MWAAFSSTSPDMKVTKAFLSKKKKDRPGRERGGRKGEGKSGGTLTGGKLREGPKERKNSARGHSSSSSKVREATTSSPIRFTSAGWRRSCWRDLSGEFEVESVIDGDEFIVAVSHRMVDTPGDSHKGFWGKGHK